ncbi:MAG: alanine racemase [Aquificaceae bacterium]
MPRAILKIKKEHIKENVKNLYKYSGKPIIAVIKANAYGIGALPISLLLEGMEEVSAFAVACVEEGIELREAGIKKKILVLGGVLKGEAKAFIEYNLTPVVSHQEHLKVLEGLNIPIHIKYDTGMGRLGFLDEVVKDERVEGVLSHFSSPLDRDFSLLQIERFEKIVKRYTYLKYIHMESSAALVYKIPFTTHVRIGLALYGERPMQDYPIELKRALELKAKIISIKDLPTGFPISYSRSYITERPTRVGVVAFGYADGLMKSLSNKAHLYYRGKPVKILGNITMDMTMVDLTGMEAKIGDWVEVVGENQSFTDLAKLAGTIPYELMTNLSSRIRREVC